MQKSIGWALKAGFPRFFAPEQNTRPLAKWGLSRFNARLFSHTRSSGRQAPRFMAIRIKARHGESVAQMLRRFKKLCEKEGLTKEIKRRQYYEKPSERARRDARRSVTRTVRPLSGDDKAPRGPRRPPQF